MTSKQCEDDFRRGSMDLSTANPNNFIFRILKQASTRLTTPSIIAYANNCNGTQVQKLDDGEILQKVTDCVEVQMMSFTNNPSEYLEEDNEKAKEYDHILIRYCQELESSNGLTNEEDEIIKGRYKNDMQEYKRVHNMQE